jgi:hypothetical protein
MSSIRSRLNIRSCPFQAPTWPSVYTVTSYSTSKKLARSSSLLFAARQSVPYLACLGRNCNWPLP